MIRSALLLLVIAVLVILVLSNLSPVALTFLGIQTQALPLGVWVAGAIVAGALTTILISILVNLARPATSTRRSSQRFGASRFVASPPPPPWSGAKRQEPPSTSASGSFNTSSYTSSSTQRTGDDWETNRPTAAWDEWGNAVEEPIERQPFSPPEIRDREDEPWANWEGYEELEPNRRERQERDEFEDVDVTDRFSASEPDYTRRTDFEVKQEPETRTQSGSIYSYSYRKPNEPESVKPTAKPGEVYDADYRVITPPFRPDPEESVDSGYETPYASPASRQNFAQEDQDEFDDELDDELDDEFDDEEDNEDRAPWDDDDWGLEDNGSSDRGDRPKG